MILDQPLPIDANGLPLPPRLVDGRLWTPTILIDGEQCRRCRRPIRVGEVVYERPVDAAGFVCSRCAGE